MALPALVAGVLEMQTHSNHTSPEARRRLLQTAARCATGPDGDYNGTTGSIARGAGGTSAGAAIKGNVGKMRLTRTASGGRLIPLALGDVVALMLFIAVGLANHDMTENLVADVLRIGAPFLIGWFVAALAVGAYSPAFTLEPRTFMLRSALAWVIGIGLALLLRNTVFGEDWSLVFAIIAYVFNGLFLLGWRAVYARMSRGR